MPLVVIRISCRVLGESSSGAGFKNAGRCGEGGDRKGVISALRKPGRVCDGRGVNRIEARRRGLSMLALTCSAVSPSERETVKKWTDNRPNTLRVGLVLSPHLALELFLVASLQLVWICDDRSALFNFQELG